MDIMSLATELNLVGKLIYNYLFSWIQTWGSGSDVIGAFGITVIFFTLFLKIATSPLDVWQKVLARKNSKKMEIMKPELEKLNKNFGNNKDVLMAKQRELYKKHKYSAFGACLPSLVTLVIFFVIFGGFNSAVKHHNSVVFDELSNVYNTTYTQVYSEEAGKGNADAYAVATESAEQAVLASYKPEKFLLTTNIFMPDTWKNPIPDISTYAGTGMGKLGIEDVNATEYEKVMKPIFEEYNVNENGKSKWNGYLILPLLCIVVSFISTKLIKQPEQPQMAGQTEEQAKMQQSQAKTMQFMMPIMMGVFSLFYSAAFTLYMLISNLFTLIFNLVFNIVTKQIDAKEKDRLMSTTVKK